MDEKEPILPVFENKEKEPVYQILRNIASELGFNETLQLQDIENRAIECSKLADSPESTENFNSSIAQIQIVGESLTDQEDPRSVLAQVGLILVRAAVLFESGRLEDCGLEIYDALTSLDNLVESHPEISAIIQKLEELDGILKGKIEQKS